METKKTILVGVIIIIFMITLGAFVVIMAKKGIISKAPAPANNTTNFSSQIKEPTDNNAKASNPTTQIDSEMAAMEADLESINDTDFSESGLSDQELGL